jgi:hypothetical protein
MSVTATEKARSSIKGSQTVTVTPGAAKTLAVSGIVNPYAAGSKHSVTVKALDAYGNVATAYTGTIHFSSSDTQATLPADYTFTASDKGAHAFASSLSPALTLKTAGSKSVTATDMSKSTISGSMTVKVTPGAAKSFRVAVNTNPWPGGSTHTFSVTALDAYGNVATGYTGTVHFTISDSSGTVPTDYTFTPADKGAHSFSATVKPSLTFKSLGTQWVRATDKSTPSITGSQTVTVI